MSACPRCGAAFSCGMVDDKTAEPCWCTKLPVLSQNAFAAAGETEALTCFCPACLQALTVSSEASLPDKP